MEQSSIKLAFLIHCRSTCTTYTKIGTIQRRLAWPLRKDDTQIREAFHIFSHFSSLFFRYIQAATSPKDVVILLDVSGSMMGLRTEIAKATVKKIIDTLSDDDFFNVLNVLHALNHNRTGPRKCPDVILN